MRHPNKLFQPELETNPFYKVAFAADFTQIYDEKQLKSAFDGKLDELVSVIEKTLAPIQSIKQVTETFYFSSLYLQGFVG